MYPDEQTKQSSTMHSKATERAQMQAAATAMHSKATAHKARMQAAEAARKARSLRGVVQEDTSKPSQPMKQTFKMVPTDESNPRNKD